MNQRYVCSLTFKGRFLDEYKNFIKIFYFAGSEGAEFLLKYNKNLLKAAQIVGIRKYYSKISKNLYCVRRRAYMPAAALILPKY